MHYIALHCITLHYIALHCITLHYIALHCITLHYIALHCITLHYIALHCITLHYIALHCITLHYIALHCITLHYITLHYIALHYITLHYNALQCITLHYVACTCVGIWIESREWKTSYVRYASSFTVVNFDAIKVAVKPVDQKPLFTRTGSFSTSYWNITVKWWARRRPICNGILLVLQWHYKYKIITEKIWESSVTFTRKCRFTTFHLFARASTTRIKGTLMTCLHITRLIIHNNNTIQMVSKSSSSDTPLTYILEHTHHSNYSQLLSIVIDYC